MVQCATVTQGYLGCVTLPTAARSNLASPFGRENNKKVRELRERVVETGKGLLGAEHPDAMAGMMELACVKPLD